MRILKSRNLILSCLSLLATLCGRLPPARLFPLLSSRIAARIGAVRRHEVEPRKCAMRSSRARSPALMAPCFSSSSRTIWARRAEASSSTPGGAQLRSEIVCRWPVGVGAPLLDLRAQSRNLGLAPGKLVRELGPACGCPCQRAFEVGALLLALRQTGVGPCKHRRKQQGAVLLLNECRCEPRGLAVRQIAGVIQRRDLRVAIRHHSGGLQDPCLGVLERRVEDRELRSCSARSPASRAASAWASLISAFMSARCLFPSVLMAASSSPSRPGPRPAARKGRAPRGRTPADRLECKHRRLGAGIVLEHAQGRIRLAAQSDGRVEQDVLGRMRVMPVPAVEELATWVAMSSPRMATRFAVLGHLMQGAAPILEQAPSS